MSSSAGLTIVSRSASIGRTAMGRGRRWSAGTPRRLRSIVWVTSVRNSMRFRRRGQMTFAGRSISCLVGALRRAYRPSAVPRTEAGPSLSAPRQPGGGWSAVTVSRSPSNSQRKDRQCKQDGPRGWANAARPVQAQQRSINPRWQQNNGPSWHDKRLLPGQTRRK